MPSATFCEKCSGTGKFALKGGKVGKCFKCLGTGVVYGKEPISLEEELIYFSPIDKSYFTEVPEIPKEMFSPGAYITVASTPKVKSPSTDTLKTTLEEQIVSKLKALTSKKEIVMPEIKQTIPEIQADGRTLRSFGIATLVSRNNLEPDEKNLVPAHDDKFYIDIDNLEEIALAIQSKENLLLVGPTGAGKTVSVEELAYYTNQPLVVQNLRGDIRSSAFLGQVKITIDPETKQAITKFVDGILPTAMRRGWWLLLDELDAAPPAILFVLQRVLTHGQLILDDDGGRIVIANENFRIIATANTLGRGDDSGLYSGTNILNEAFLDRFGTVIEMNYLGSEQPSVISTNPEVKILRDKAKIDISVIMKMVNVARLIRKGFAEERCYCTFSTRRLIAWAKKYSVLKDINRSASLTILNKLTKEDRVFVGETIQRVFGSSK